MNNFFKVVIIFGTICIVILIVLSYVLCVKYFHIFLYEKHFHQFKHTINLCEFLTYLNVLL